MLSDGVRNLINFRIEQAYECLDSAEREVNANAYKTAANRSYFWTADAIRSAGTFLPAKRLFKKGTTSSCRSGAP